MVRAKIDLKKKKKPTFDLPGKADNEKANDLRSAMTIHGLLMSPPFKDMALP